MPGRSIVLANLSGGPLDHTGVMQGMSGSPVFVEGRLLGAVAYAFPFSRDPICGITPFEEMIRFTETSARGPAAASAAALRFTPEGLPSFDLGAEAGFVSGGRLLLPIRTPVAASGLGPGARQVLAPVFRQLGMEISPGGLTVPRSSRAQGEAPRLGPGSPVGATLIGGDLVLMASGTVTHVDEATGEVYAFGHPFTGLGSISIPMQEAQVEASVASLFTSFRLASAGAPIGVWRQDRATGIRGSSATAPGRSQCGPGVDGSRGGRRDYNLELVDHDLLSPVLAFTALASVLGAGGTPAGAQTIRLGARIGLAGGRTVSVEDTFASGGSGVITPAAALVAAPLALLLGNPVERDPRPDYRGGGHRQRRGAHRQPKPRLVEVLPGSPPGRRPPRGSRCGISGAGSVSAKSRCRCRRERRGPASTDGGGRADHRRFPTRRQAFRRLPPAWSRSSGPSASTGGRAASMCGCWAPGGAPRWSAASTCPRCREHPIRAVAGFLRRVHPRAFDLGALGGATWISTPRSAGRVSSPSRWRPMTARGLAAFGLAAAVSGLALAGGRGFWRLRDLGDLLAERATE